MSQQENATKLTPDGGSAIEELFWLPGIGYLFRSLGTRSTWLLIRYQIAIATNRLPIFALQLFRSTAFILINLGEEQLVQSLLEFFFA